MDACQTRLLHCSSFQASLRPGPEVVVTLSSGAMSREVEGPARNRAILVGVQLPGVKEDELHSSLDELERLGKTLGLNVVGRVTQARPHTRSAIVLGPGKLKEVAQLTGGTGVVPAGASHRQTGARPADLEDEALLGAEPEELEEFGEEEGGPEERADVLLFDHDLTPAQIRNVEGATAAEVLDRTSVILSIFQRHARTREAKIQVEIARLTYLAPRLRVAGAGRERQRGGVGGKGAGESALELDRRRVRDRIAELRKDLVAAQRETDLRRTRRAHSDTVALVGYTNAGKSSLMRGLTGSEVLVRDQLFATLDTTVRQLAPATRPQVLVSDTVGFIKKLPHDLVASFRSTLEEARDAALLLNVVDVSDPAWRDQLAVTREVLGEIDALEVPSLLLLNKIDQLSPQDLQDLQEDHADAVFLSAHRVADVADLHGRIAAFFEEGMAECELLVTYGGGRLVNSIHESCRVMDERHDTEGTILRIRAPLALVDEFVAQGATRVGEGEET